MTPKLNLDKKKILLYDSIMSSWVDLEGHQLTTLNPSPTIDIILSTYDPNEILDLPTIDSATFRNQEPELEIQKKNVFDIKALEVDEVDPDHMSVHQEELNDDVNEVVVLAKLGRDGNREPDLENLDEENVNDLKNLEIDQIDPVYMPARQHESDDDVNEVLDLPNLDSAAFRNQELELEIQGKNVSDLKILEVDEVELDYMPIHQEELDNNLNEVVNLSNFDSSACGNREPELEILDEENVNDRKNLKVDDSEDGDPDYIPIHREESDDSDVILEHVPLFPATITTSPVPDQDTAANNNLIKTSRGRKRKFDQQTNLTAKKLKNSNQDFYNYKGKLVKQKIFQNLQCPCKAECHNRVGEDIRCEEFNKFWGLGDYNAQNMFLAACVKEKDKVRQYTNRPPRRQFSRLYNLRNISVCREMFRHTFQISTKRINTALQKIRSEELKDKRGQKQGGRNKTSGKKLESVKDHINKLPRYKSHYRRNNTDSEFLSPDMTLVKMYDLYVESVIGEENNNEIKKWREGNENKKSIMLKEIDAVSFSTYRRIFLNNFNLKFKSLKKDTCNTCDSFAARLQSATGLDKCVLEEAHNKHIDLWRDARKRMNDDKMEAQKNKEFECISYDLEKTLPLPRIPTSIVFYKRQLWLYNAGVHSFKNNQGYCYVWTENQAGRGAQEIGSCLIKYIETEVENGIKHLVLWSDSCGGQNRNIKMVLILKSCLESHPTLITIHMKYLVSGHSFLANDTDFSDIEGALLHVQRLYLPSDYVQVMKRARKKKPFIVTEMKGNYFVGTQKLEKIIVNRKINEEKEKINWLKIREIKLVKEEPLKLYCRNDFESEYSLVNLERKIAKGRQQNNISFKGSLQPMWENGKDIAAPKLKDLKSLFHLIPADAKDFYRSLSGSRDVEDDVDGFGIPPDFEVENPEEML